MVRKVLVNFFECPGGVYMSIAGVQHHFGCFDEEDAAGRMADEVSRLLGAHEKCNFDKYGFETGYDGSAVGQANLSLVVPRRRTLAGRAGSAASSRAAVMQHARMEPRFPFRIADLTTAPVPDSLGGCAPGRSASAN